LEQVKLTLLFSQFKQSYMQNFPKSLAELKLESGDVVFQDVCVLYLQMYFIV